MGDKLTMGTAMQQMILKPRKLTPAETGKLYPKIIVLNIINPKLCRNNPGGCSRPETKGHCVIGSKRLKHGCSKVVNNNKMCWSTSHKESGHP